MHDRWIHTNRRKIPVIRTPARRRLV